MPVKALVHDDMESRTGRDEYGRDSPYSRRPGRLVRETDGDRTRGTLVRVGAHIPVGILSEENEPCIAQSSVTEVSEARLFSRLHGYTNQVLRIAARQPFDHTQP